MKTRTRMVLTAALLLTVAAVFWWSTPRPPQPSPSGSASTPSPMLSPDEAPPSATTTSVSSPSATREPSPGAPAPSGELVDSQSAPAADTPPPAPAPSAAEDEPAPTAPAPPAAPEGDVSADLEMVDTALREYRTALGENPVGSNAEITRALLGDNLKQVRIGTPPGSSVGPEGELADRWGTPYFFHQLSGTRMEIRSAGPDQRMWTRDDAVIGKAAPEPEPEMGAAE